MICHIDVGAHFFEHVPESALIGDGMRTELPDVEFPGPSLHGAHEVRDQPTQPTGPLLDVAKPCAEAASEPTVRRVIIASISSQA